MESYIPHDTHYEEATNLAAYMGERDVDMIKSILECNQALCKGKPCPKQHLRSERKASRADLEIKQPLFAELLPELQASWAQEQDHLKEQVIGNSRICQLRITSYLLIVVTYRMDMN